MNLDRPLEVVTPSIDGDVLAVLAGASAAFTAPTVTDLIGEHSVEGVRRSLRRLRGQGIVHATRVGRTWSYELNREHLAAPYLEALAGLRRELLGRIGEAVAAWSPAAEVVALFGSAATGTMRPESDLDLFVVRPDAVGEDHPGWNRQVSRLEADVTGWSGNDARVLELSAMDAADALASGERVLADIVRDGIVLGGRAGSLRALAAIRS